MYQSKWIKQQSRHLHSKTSHAHPTEEKRSTPWFHSGKTNVTLERSREREWEREREWREFERWTRKRWEGGYRFMHPNTQCTRNSNDLGSFLSSPSLVLLLTPQPPLPACVFRFYLSCVQAQASVKWAGETSAASVLSSSWETHASITCNTESFLATSVCLIHSRWMVRQRMISSSILANPSYLPVLRSPVENVDKSLSEVHVQLFGYYISDKPVLKRT